MEGLNKNRGTLLGLMSGTSLDGLDMALCLFEKSGSGYTFTIIKAQTIEYSLHLKDQLKKAPYLGAESYFHLHSEYGRYLGDSVKDFCRELPQPPDAIASHGHTVFHQPKLGFSTQLGCGATLAATCGLPVVCDFRSLDVALGGQGAPLVPMGDELLFSEYEACLNLGGIANISYKHTSGDRLAFDICVANMLLNTLAKKLGCEYDDGGKFARTGKIQKDLLEQMNALSFYRQKGARSLGREWMDAEMLPLLISSNSTTEDLLCTACEHIAEKISESINGAGIQNVLVSGGGAYNEFLLERIRSKTLAKLIIPDDSIIQFKEALIFAFLGFLRLNDQVNTLASVTGASKDSCGGSVYRSH